MNRWTSGGATWYRAFRAPSRSIPMKLDVALKESVSMIVQAAKSVLEKTPPELSADIIDRGVFLDGRRSVIERHRPATR